MINYCADARQTSARTSVSLLFVPYTDRRLSARVNFIFHNYRNIVILFRFM